MPRLVPLAGGPPPSSDSNYLERVAKYIPGEVIASYKACFALVLVQAAENPARLPVAWFVFGFFFVATPIYLKWMNSRAKDPLTGGPLRIQLIIGTVSFVVWSYALGGPFALEGQAVVLDGYQAWIAEIFLIMYTFAVGAYKPTA